MHMSTPSIRPGQPMVDAAGHRIDAHGGGFLHDNGTFFWYGSSRKNHPDPPGYDRGINLYSSRDLYSWRFEGLVVKPLASTASNENGLDLERPKVLRCAGRYVMWLRGTPVRQGSLLKAGVLTSPTPRGPFEWVVEREGADPFHLLAGRYQYGDATLWSDAASGEAFVYWRARTREAGFRAMRLNDACTDVLPGTDTRIFASPNREAPAFFAHAGSYYLWASGTLGWEPVQAYVYNGPTPLGPFNQSTGHGWHAYTKLPGANASSQARYRVRDGYLPTGHDWIPERNATVGAAESLCSHDKRCRGFTFKAYDRRPSPEVAVRCAFKTVDTFVPEGDPEGLQPPPIPEPGARGNRRSDGQPGEWAYGSQSTFVLPNPAWREGTGLPQFVYLADRWQPRTPDFGIYVWLPLFVHPTDPARVSVVWHDAWRLDNVSSPFA